MEKNYVYTKQFVKQYWDQLVEIGIPVVALDNIGIWTYLIEHGDTLPVIPFMLNDLESNNLLKLYDIISIYDDILAKNIRVILFRKIFTDKYKCPCCGIYSYEEEIGGTYFICPICNWEDDAIQLREPDNNIGANRYSLNESRLNFLRYGYCEKKSRKRKNTAY